MTNAKTPLFTAEQQARFDRMGSPSRSHNLARLQANSNQAIAALNSNAKVFANQFADPLAGTTINSRKA